MSRTRLPPWLARSLILVGVTLISALVLTIGRTESVAVPEVGQVAAQDFIADQPIEVIDDAATEAARAAAAASVADVYTVDATVSQRVRTDLELFFREVSLEEYFEQERPVVTTTTTTPTTTTTLAAEQAEDTTTTSSTTTTSTTTTTTTLVIPDVATQESELAEAFPLLGQDVIVPFVAIAEQDLALVRAGENAFLLVEAESAAVAMALRELSGDGIRADELSAVQDDLVANPPPSLSSEFPDRAEAEAAVARLVALRLDSNSEVDEAATEEARQEARESEEAVTVSFQTSEKIVEEGEVVDAVEAAAIADLLTRQVGGPAQGATLAAVAAIVLILGLYLRRNRPVLWASPKLLALFGLLVTLAALTARLVSSFGSVEDPAVRYVFPAAAFGYLAGVLFDTRIALLLAVPVAAFVGLATESLALTVYAAAAVLTPLPFVSSASSRRELRLAALYATLLVIPIAAATAWFFLDSSEIPAVVGWAVAGSVLGSIAGLGVLPFLDNLFGVTTTLTLLDLTDRNHEALRLLEEKAPGTFNHSILVGTIAGRAARSIGANPLLAEAAAYYHDLGKTENPSSFIENQFGHANPHSWLPPEESAQIVRSHVIDGLRLARDHKIPAEVAEGIRQHHGTSLMRYFYQKAIDQYGEAALPEDYRHVGQKPQTKEMAILMLSDAVEGAARALAYQEQPTTDGIRKIVTQVVDEKVEDGQLEESALTFGELTRVKAALVDALVSHYHHRIAYPNFPGGDNNT